MKALVTLLVLAAGTGLRAQEAPAPVPTPPAENPPATEPAPADPEQEAAFRAFRKFATAVDLVRRNYVDEGKTNYDNLVEAAIRGMVGSLDPHSRYQEKPSASPDPGDGTASYDPLGLILGLRDGVITIVNVQEEGAAAIAGILPGNQLMRIGDIPMTRVGLTEALRLLQGKPEEKVTLLLRRPSTNAFLEKTLARSEPDDGTIRDAHLVSPVLAGERKIGYVRLLEFAKDSPADLETALTMLEKQGMEALVLDLRNNPGGLLDAAVEVLSLFLDPGLVVVTTEGRTPSENPPPLRTSARPKVFRLPLVVLVDHGSASASELVAAALQDLRRAVIVGTQTFGKGSVQSIVPMPGGGSLRLTIAKYYTPGHRTIHEHGVTPNIIATLTPSAEEHVNQWRSGMNRQGPLPEQLANLGDAPVERAVDLLRGLLALSAATPPEKPAPPAPAPGSE